MSFRNTVESDFQQGLRLHNAGRFNEAEKSYRRVLARSPRHVFALNNLGHILFTKGDLKAVDYGRRAAEIDQKNPRTWLNLAIIAERFRIWSVVDAATREAAALAPDDIEILRRRGLFLFMTNQLVEGCQVAARARELAPTNPSIAELLAAMLYRQGFLDEALDVCRKGLSAGNGSQELHSAYLFYQHFSPQPKLANLYADAVDFGRTYADPVTPPRSEWPKPSGGEKKRLRIGFVSCDFSAHPVSYFFLPLLSAKSSEHTWDFIGYHSDRFEDAVTKQISSFATLWRNVSDLSDNELADLIRQDKIDILFDLNGHTGTLKRLLTFARKPAPVQATWIGYFDTTGVSAIDYILADRFCIRPEDERYYVEKIAYMPDDFLCYSAPVDATPVAQLPALQNGYLTFGSANQITKITPDVISLWAEVLHAVSGSRLRLKTKGLRDAETIVRVTAAFAEFGIEADRLDLLGPGPQREMFEFYGTVDVALDPFPCAGGTTTCEALWSGVPVVSLVGDRFCGRHSGSHLRAAGLPQFAVDDREAYIALCKSTAANFDALAQLRADIRTQMVMSPLMNASRFADGFDQVVRGMWVERLRAALN